RITSKDVRRLLKDVDCLVLPSDHEGWGAVVSEALLSGVPAVCSDRCGVAEVVRASGYGDGVRSGDEASLTEAIRACLVAGILPLDRRERLRRWADGTISAGAGAAYLQEILAHVYHGSNRPAVPWAVMHR